MPIEHPTRSLAESLSERRPRGSVHKGQALYAVGPDGSVFRWRSIVTDDHSVSYWSERIGLEQPSCWLYAYDVSEADFQAMPRVWAEYARLVIERGYPEDAPVPFDMETTQFV